MKQENLEKYIINNKAVFNDESPPPIVWMNIERSLEELKDTENKRNKTIRFSMMRMMQVAAMLVIVLGVGLLIGLQIKDNQLPIGEREFQEFAETEHYYKNQIDDMMTFVKGNPSLEDDQIESDIKALDQVYEELKLELIESGGTNGDALIDAMIQNYRSKIEILETVLDKYQKKNQDNKINIEDGKIEI